MNDAIEKAVMAEIYKQAGWPKIIYDEKYKDHPPSFMGVNMREVIKAAIAALADGGLDEKTKKLFEAFASGDSFSGRYISEEELFQEFLPLYRAYLTALKGANHA